MHAARHYSLIAIVLIFIGASAASGAKPSTRPANDDLVPLAIKAIDAGDLKGFQSEVEHRVTPLTDKLAKADAYALARLSSFREFAKFFSRLDALSDIQKKTLTWLVAQPRLLPTLMGALSEQDPPDNLLDLLTQLQKQEGATLEEYPELTTAFLVVWGKSPEAESASVKIDVPHLLRVYHYFTKSKALRFDPHDLPWQMQVYVVDMKISEKEIVWAVDHYRNRGQIGGAYFDVPYDLTSYYTGTGKENAKYDYVLPNLLRYGGVCVDQAYFATQIAKSLGVPACTCYGEGGSGQAAHAWVGYLDVRGRRAVWDFDQGRYREYLFWAAQIIDPQTMETISDADVSLLSELQNVPAAQRLASCAIAKLADFVEPAHRLELLTKAIDLSPGNRPAWMALAQLGADHGFSDAQSNAIGDVIRRYVAKPYPEFACTLLMKIAAGKTAEQQVAALDKIGPLFHDRPDLLARIRVEQGDRLRAVKHIDQAMRAYGDVLINDLNAGPVIVTALKNVDEILHGSNELKRLAAIYDVVWKRMPVPDPSAYAVTTPYYQIGEAYLNVLQELGDANTANNVQMRLAVLTRVAARPPR